MSAENVCTKRVFCFRLCRELHRNKIQSKEPVCGEGFLRNYLSLKENSDEKVSNSQTSSKVHIQKLAKMHNFLYLIR